MARRTRIIETDEFRNPQENGDSNQVVANDPADDNENETGTTDASASAGVTGFTVVDHADDAKDDPLSSIEVIEAAPRRGRPAGQTRARIPKATPSEIAQAAPLMVGLTNQVVVSWLGPECAMLQTEANFITPCVARVLTRLPRGAAQQVSLYTDPFIILTALGLWATRIARIKDQQAKQKYVVEPREAARSYGESGTEFTATEQTTTEPPINKPDDARNGQARAANDAIFRTVSST